MKKKLIITSIFLFFVLNSNVFGVSQPLLLDNSNYVVIGAFAIQDNASHFVESAKKLNFKAELAINPTRKLYYVYVLHTGSISEAIAEAKKIRSEGPFNDTWVFKGLLGEGEPNGTDVNPETKQQLSKVEVVDNTLVEKSTLTEQKNLDAQVTATSTNLDEKQPVETSSIVTPTPVAETSRDKVSEAETGGKGFIFKVASTHGKELKGEIDIIDADRLTKEASYEGNKRVYIKPVNKSGKVSLICEVFGYRKVQKELNYNMPDTTSGVQMENGNVIVPFDLTRLRKGDIAIMYNVYFFKDAAIMRPESRYEVTSLMEMMKENPKLKIRLHGHTNGNSSGKITRIGESKNFFSLNGGSDGFGSAKELSESRAEAIRDFLISEGIDQSRLFVKAWGGKKAIHDKKSNKAHENVRVEVEIVED